MLTLLIYAPCEKVIVSNDDTVSAISIMETIGVNIAGEIPGEAVAPIRWTVLSLWKRDQEIQEPIQMEERTEVFRPDGTLATGGTTAFTVSNEHLFYRSLLQIPIFPIGLPGFVKVKCSTRQTNPETEWTEFAEFPLLVIHKPVQIEPANPEAAAQAVPQAANDNRAV